MAYFSYKGRTLSGKGQKGRITAETKKEALIRLKQQGIHVFDIRQLNSVLYKEISFGKKVKSKDFIIFLRQLSTLIYAGIPIIEATTIMKEQMENKVFKEVLETISDDIQSGESLSIAMGKHPTIFPRLLVNMIHAGEISGNIDEILDNMATYFEKQYELRQKIISSLTYPGVVATISLLVTIFLLTFIVPIFSELFESYGEELPAYTAFILQLSGGIQTYWWVILLFLASVIFIYKSLQRQEKYAYRFDLWKLKIPIFGRFMQKALLTRLTQTLSILLASSIPILQAVAVTERVMDNKVIKGVLKESQKGLEEGQSLVKPMENHWLFPRIMTQMIIVGERSGSLDEMLLKVSDFYEKELDNASDKLKVLLEPLMIVLLTVIVGAIVLAIIIPMFSIFEAI